jgi:hypothetical protein
MRTSGGNLTKVKITYFQAAVSYMCTLEPRLILYGHRDRGKGVGDGDSRAITVSVGGINLYRIGVKWDIIMIPCCSTCLKDSANFDNSQGWLHIDVALSPK